MSDRAQRKALKAAIGSLPPEERMKLLLDWSSANREAGREALRAVLFVNGGSAVALLGFLGALASSDRLVPLGVAMNRALIAFALGVFFAVWGFGFRYFSEAAAIEAHRKDDAVRRASAHTKRAIASGVLAILAFLIGVLLVWSSFRQQFAA